MLKSQIDYLAAYASVIILVDSQKKRLTPEIFVHAFSGTRDGDQEEMVEMLHTLGLIDRMKMSELSLAKWK